VVISPGVGVSNTSRSGSSSLLNSLGRLHINPLLGSGHLIVSGVPVAFGDSVGSVISDTGVGQAVGRRLSSDGRQDSITGLDLGSGSMRNSRVRNNLLRLFGALLNGLSIVVGGLVFLGKGLDLGKRGLQLLAGHADNLIVGSVDELQHRLDSTLVTGVNGKENSLDGLALV
jgi:hypothetical protein